MAMRNKIKSFVDKQGLTVYQFRQRTKIANKTAYDLYNNPFQYPGRDVMDKICSAFEVQPGELLEWLPGDLSEILDTADEDDAQPA